MSSGIKRRLEEFGFDTGRWGPTRLLFSVVSHELCGAGILVGAWYLCYRVRVTSSLLKYAPNHMTKYYSQGELWSRKKFNQFPVLQNNLKDPYRVFESGVESFVLRKLFAPVLIPSKLLFAYFVGSFFGE